MSECVNCSNKAAPDFIAVPAPLCMKCQLAYCAWDLKYGLLPVREGDDE